MTFNQTKILEIVRKEAENAKPGFLKLNGKMYTFVFERGEGVYKVYEDMIFYVNFNTKKLSAAKKYLSDYVNN